LVTDAFRDQPDVIAAVGFNRRYSPLVQKAKSAILRNGTPVVINYRVNAGYISPESWVQDLEEGGGRIIGEACHFLDLISYLSGSNIKSFDAVHIPVNGRSIQSEDNIIVTLSFENGSIGVLTYTSIGGKEMDKERIEIFTGNSSIVIDDFIEMQTYNSNENGLKLKKTDKGHIALVEELAKKIKGLDSLIVSFDQDIQSTNLTLLALDRIHKVDETYLL
jgi:predicted dehydrogenase